MSAAFTQCRTFFCIVDNKQGIPKGMTKREKACSTKRAEESTLLVVREGVCKSKGWNGRWDAKGAGEAQVSSLALPLRMPKGNSACWDPRATQTRVPEWRRGGVGDVVRRLRCWDVLVAKIPTATRTMYVHSKVN